MILQTLWVPLGPEYNAIEPSEIYCTWCVHVSLECGHIYGYVHACLMYPRSSAQASHEAVLQEALQWILILQPVQLRKSDWFGRTRIFDLSQDVMELAGSFGLNTGVIDSSVDEGIFLLQLDVASKRFGQYISEPIEV